MRLLHTHAMNRQHGYTLIETLVTLTLLLILSAGGIYSWQRWQQQQRLWQTASQVRDYLLLLRDDANWHNRNRPVWGERTAEGWCLTSAEPPTGCDVTVPFTLRPHWSEVTLSHITPGLGFYGLRNSAWAGHIRLQSGEESWNIIVSHWGRVRLCRNEESVSCQ
ncbi:prepilin peptidase-dependent protein [Enterobacteriaceae bacterium ESL0689]|nr:prepilin peptidase-dependent protein [Enterobacteriaceae bacterium ESL0689]